jgi:hypothetical protein
VRVRLIAQVAQTIGLLGTLVGAFTIAIGIGPRSLADIVFHVTMLAVLASGLVVSARGDQPTGQVRPTAAARLLSEVNNR